MFPTGTGPVFGMAEYRVYKIKGKNIAGPPVVFEAPSDEVAAEHAKQMTDGLDVELWQANRFVIGFRASDK